MNVDEVVNAAQAVYESIGAGHSEAAYHSALEVELSARGHQFNSEARLVVKHRGQSVAHRRPDVMIATDSGPIIVELKANKRIRDKQRRQLESYVSMSREDNNVETAHAAILINFGPDRVTTEKIDCGPSFDVEVDVSEATA
jgi:GxxExxY protein